MDGQTATMDVEKQRDEILAAMAQLADTGLVPGEVTPGEIVHRGDAELDVQMMVSGGKRAAIVYIYDTQTGERSRTNANMIPTQLSKKRADGSTVFTLRDPGIVPLRGTMKCMLHADDPNRKQYDRWGLGTCGKDNLASRQDVKAHMQNRHKREWATIEEERLRLKDERNEKLQEAILQGAAAGAAASRQLESELMDTPRRGRPPKEAVPV